MVLSYFLSTLPKFTNYTQQTNGWQICHPFVCNYRFLLNHNLFTTHYVYAAL